MTDRPTHTRETTKELGVTVEHYRNTSTLDKANVFTLKVTAPTVEDAEKLFTDKLKELKEPQN